MNEVPDEAMRKWPPRQVIAEMLTVDPHADQTSIISVGIEETYGVPSSNMSVFGEDRRFSLKWANTNHNALGNFLHAPTLFQIESGQTPSAEKILKKAKEVATTIEHIVSAPIFNINFGVFYEIECNCGGHFKRRRGSFKREDGIKCPSCGAIWDVVSEDAGASEDQTTFKKREVSYVCFACGMTNYIGVHNVKEGVVFICKCGAKSQVALALHPLDNESKSEQTPKADA